MPATSFSANLGALLNRPAPKNLPEHLLCAALLAQIAVMLYAKWQLLGTINVNWDEFYFLSLIHEHAAGTLSAPMQTFHVHLFSWLVGMDGTATDQVLLARRVLFVFQIGGCVCVYAIARKLMSAPLALMSVLASLTFSFVLMNGSSFRTDSILCFLMLLTTCMLVCHHDKRWAAIVAAAATAVAVMVSVKAVLYAPTMLLLSLAGLPEGRLRIGLKTLLPYGIAASAFAAVLLALHVASLSEPPSSAWAQRFTSDSSSMFGSTQAGTLALSEEVDEIWWWLFLCGLAAAAWELTKPAERRYRGMVILALALPTTSLFFYRNTFAYFYVGIVPFCALAIGAVFLPLEKRQVLKEKVLPLLVLASSLLLSSQTWALYKLNAEDGNAAQQTLLRTIATLFPQPVPYIDRCSMISQFPKKGLFMSTLILSRYREQQSPIMEKIVRTEQPPLLIQNTPGLLLGLDWETIAEETPYALLREDHEFLQGQYLPYWGPIWLAGHQLDVGREPKRLEILVPGAYAMQSKFPVMVDGTQHPAVSTVNLTAGWHEFRSAESSDALTLRFGANLPPPPEAEPPAFRRLFTGFGFRQPRSLY